MNAMDMVVQALELGAELLGSATKRAKDFGETAREQANEFSDFASERAEDFGKAARDRVRDFGETASEVIGDLRDRAPKKAKRLRKKLQEQFAPEPAVRTRVLPFVAGFSLGLGAALLLAPRSGRETRERLTQRGRNIEFPKTADIG